MNKSVFITGGTVNTGFGVARKFAAEGYSVFIASRSAEKAYTAAEKITAEFGVYAKGYGLSCNLDEQEIETVFDDIRGQGYLIDCLVLNAANLGIRQEFLTVSAEDFLHELAPIRT